MSAGPRKYDCLCLAYALLTLNAISAEDPNVSTMGNIMLLMRILSSSRPWRDSHNAQLPF